MKSQTQKIEIAIDRVAAISIINCLRKGLSDSEKYNPTSETKGANDLLKLLDGNFINSTSGIHFS